ncbi:FAD-dependent oxidoreductase [Lentzea sp. NEAU-D7]|uniref:FAD-dependent oxidoreductase n=1 Tax=Lentzea sp. NEAU-D7 TaxID=2994667 RepID=UPI00224B3E6D|nr:FAD-dependent monooxygenase [Lentzea sp. NEAU-D7]MCX2951413.1 FAD-dependent oxidoreductase [Lentzea sp. NEAU-D7]
MPTRRALVVGAGVAGLTTALRLLRSDWEIVLVERASRFADDGFPCALRGAGWDAAGRLGVLGALTERSQPRCGTVVIDRTGVPFALSPKPSSRVPVLRHGDVVSVLREAVGDVLRRAEVLRLVEDDCGVTVEFTGGDADWFDLVVGADGTDSAVRGAVYGDQKWRGQGFSVVSGRLQGSSRDAVRMDLPRRSIRVHPLHDGQSAALFAWRGDVGLALDDVFGDVPGLPSSLLSQVDEVRLSRRKGFQSHLRRWASKQVVLVGDAAWCSRRYCEHGVSLSIAGAELLGDALDIFPHTAEALAWWEEQMRPLVRRARRQSTVLRESEVAEAFAARPV